MATEPAVSIATAPVVEVGPRTLTIAWGDGRVSTFHHLWLCDNCPQLRHATTNHRVVETSTLPDDVHPASVQLDDDTITVTWAHDGHVSTFPHRWLRDHDYSNGVRRQRRRPVLWDASIEPSLTRAPWAAVRDDRDARRRFLTGFRDHGLALLRDVPNEPGTVLEVAARFGEVRVTSWGRAFDVISVENANSVAYTSLPLVAHTDEGYRNPAPTVQLQHFLRSDTSGGAATLVDGFKVAEDLRAADPAAFELLATVPLHFHYRDVDAEHEADGTILDVEPGGRLRAVRYSNHSVQPFLLDPELMEPFYAAYRAFGRMREDARYQLRLDLGAGELYMVDNHRVLHGRTAFTQGGARHLQSCYIERDELMSRLTVLERDTSDGAS